MLATQRELGPVEPPMSLTATVIRQLTIEIEQGRWNPGDRLPAESSMAATFGVSRTVVREAVAALKAAGLVSSRQGRGIFVVEPPSREPFLGIASDPASLEDALALLELRLALETEMSALAAERRTREELSAIEDELEELDRLIAAGDDAVDADFSFHRCVAQASGNPYFERLLAFLGTIIIPRQRIRYGLVEPATRRAYLEEIQREHRRIYAAIAAGDTAAARRQARSHMERSRARYGQLMRLGASPDQP